MQNYSMTDKEQVMSCVYKHNDMNVKYKTQNIFNWTTAMESLICRENMITSKRITPNIRTLYRSGTFNFILVLQGYINE